MGAKRAIALFLILAAFVGGLVGWTTFRRVRASYDTYLKKIQPGIRIAGVDVGWDTPEEAAARVAQQVAAPYYRDFQLEYQEQSIPLSPVDDLGLEIPVDDLVRRAVEASHQYDYWRGFALWVQGETLELDLDVPLVVTFDDSATARFLADTAETYDVAPVEPMVDVRARTFIPGRQGHRLDVGQAADLINERVLDPEQREISLPVDPIEPDQSPARIHSMLSTLGPVMEQLPTPPSFYTATIPISSTGGIQGTPLVTYTGELTWTFPYFAGYTGPLTSTYGFFFDPGLPGGRFNVEEATLQVERALRTGVTSPITFHPELVPPPPITPALLIPPLEARLGLFSGVSSLLVKNLDTGELVYEQNTDLILSGMSIVKVGIMVAVYEYYGGTVDEPTYQELRDMLGSESCNPCANRLMAAIGGGSASAGAKKVTDTMRRLGLKNFYLCGPFRIEAQWDGGQTSWVSASATSWDYQDLFVQAQMPRYDRCVHATPREMASLLEMIYQGTQERGRLLEAFPRFTAKVCQDMIDIMAANDLRNMLGAGIPAEVKLAHKHGFAGYDVSWGDTRAEVGIVFSPGATWLISFYIWEDTPWLDFGIVQPLYRDVSNMLYNYFNPDQPFWPRPPWAPSTLSSAAAAGG